MAKRYDVVATIKFKKQDGSEGKSYSRCGSAWEGDKGISVKLDTVPVSKDWDGWLNLYEPKPKDAAKGPQETQNEDADPVPF